MLSYLRANQAEFPEFSVPDEGAQSCSGGREVLPYGPGDVCGSTEHTEVGPAGRCRKATERTSWWYLLLHFIHGYNLFLSAFYNLVLDVGSGMLDVFCFFSSVCHKLELERQQHNQLKHTWQRANDQFLESQRLLMRDMQRIESVLSSEQLRQVEVIKKRDQVGHVHTYTHTQTVYSCHFLTSRGRHNRSSFTVLDQIFFILPYLSCSSSGSWIDSPKYSISHHFMWLMSEWWAT